MLFFDQSKIWKKCVQKTFEFKTSPQTVGFILYLDVALKG